MRLDTAMIKAILADRGISQAKFARLIKINQCYFSRVLSGYLTPSEKLMAKIARTLGVSQGMIQKISGGSGNRGG